MGGAADWTPLTTTIYYRTLALRAELPGSLGDLEHALDAPLGERDSENSEDRDHQQTHQRRPAARGDGP